MHALFLLILQIALRYPNLGNFDYQSPMIYEPFNNFAQNQQFPTLRKILPNNVMDIDGPSPGVGEELNFGPSLQKVAEFAAKIRQLYSGCYGSQITIFLAMPIFDIFNVYSNSYICDCNKY